MLFVFFFCTFWFTDSVIPGKIPPHLPTTDGFWEILVGWGWGWGCVWRVFSFKNHLVFFSVQICIQEMCGWMDGYTNIPTKLSIQSSWEGVGDEFYQYYCLNHNYSFYIDVFYFRNCLSLT